MQLTLLFTLGLSLQASAVPYPAGSETRDDELRRRTIENPGVLDEVELDAVDKALKQKTGKSVHDEDIRAKVLKVGNTATVEVTLPANGVSESSIPSSSPPTSGIVQNTAVDEDSSDPLDNEIPVDDAPSNKPTNAKAPPAKPAEASSPEPAPPAAQQGKAQSESEGTISTPASTGSPIPPVEVGKFRTTTPDQCYQVLNGWREKMEKPIFTKSDILEAHAKQACDQSSKTYLNHTSFANEAQVMARGNETAFEWTLVGGWLCEMANITGIGEACQAVKLLSNITRDFWDYDNQTDHAKHLSNGKYTKAGCVHANNIWTVSLSP